MKRFLILFLVCLTTVVKAQISDTTEYFMCEFAFKFGARVPQGDQFLEKYGLESTPKFSLDLNLGGRTINQTPKLWTRFSRYQAEIKDQIVGTDTITNPQIRHSQLVLGLSYPVSLGKQNFLEIKGGASRNWVTDDLDSFVGNGMVLSIGHRKQFNSVLSMCSDFGFDYFQLKHEGEIRNFNSVFFDLGIGLNLGFF